jgi:hypothetical protein
VWPVERSAGIDALVAEVEARLHAGRAPAGAGHRRG